MAAKAKVTVTYLDGHVEEFNPNRPRLLLDMEKKFGVQEPDRHEHIAFLAYHALVTLKGKDVKYDDFIDSVEDFDATPPEPEGKDDGDEPGEADPS